MAIYAFYPNATHQRRSDGIGFVLAEGADGEALDGDGGGFLSNVA
jgi:primase-polymerase (primpol)-like protein